MPIQISSANRQHPQSRHTDANEVRKGGKKQRRKKRHPHTDCRLQAAQWMCISGSDQSSVYYSMKVTFIHVLCV